MHLPFLWVFIIYVYSAVFVIQFCVCLVAVSYCLKSKLSVSVMCVFVYLLEAVGEGSALQVHLLIAFLDVALSVSLQTNVISVRYSQ